LRSIDSCITQLKASKPSRTFNESEDEEEQLPASRVEGREGGFGRRVAAMRSSCACSGFRVWDLGFWVWGLTLEVWGLGFGAWCLVFGVWGVGFGVTGL